MEERIIYCFWTGSNPITARRKECIQNMKDVTGCNVKVLYKDDIMKHILPEYPLHPAYEYLSETHKADYLRTYFMNFYGGGYADIKIQTESWIPSFEALEKSEKWVCGYKEVGPEGIAYGPVVDYWYELVGNGAYICKPQTPLTKEWYSEMLKVLDTKLEQLKRHPATYPQSCAEDGSGYPIQWNEMLGRIFHRVSFTYKEKLMTILPTPDFENYR
jgi:hypothetical protein